VRGARVGVLVGPRRACCHLAARALSIGACIDKASVLAHSEQSVSVSVSITH